ncbi:MAG: HD family hydrolase [Cucumibacter sp.]
MPRVPDRAWQRMLSGRRLDLLDPSPLDIELSDIAHGLARVARWNGQTRGDFAFSVAQHSIFVLEIAISLKADLERRGRLTVLLHDASEYVMGDIISPLKATMGGDYKALEGRLLSAVHLRFSLPAATSSALQKLIKRADREAAYFEAVNLAGFEAGEARKYLGTPTLGNLDLPDFAQLIRPWPTQQAHDRFLATFAEVAGENQ